MLMYFLPQAAGVKPAAFAVDRFGQGTPYGETSVASGPGDASGWLCGIGPEVRGLRYTPDEQHWEPVPGAAWLLGCPRSQHPTPVSMLRRDAVGGHPVTLGDGQDWAVPVVYLAGTRDDAGLPPLGVPQTMRLGADGQVAYSPEPAYAWLQEQAARFWRWFTSGSKEAAAEQSLTDADMMRLAAEALARNYYLRIEEINFLGLIRTDLLVKIGQALIDWPSWERIIAEIGNDPKKAGGGAAAGGGSNTASGETDSTPATAQPSRT